MRTENKPHWMRNAREASACPSAASSVATSSFASAATPQVPLTFALRATPSATASGPIPGNFATASPSCTEDLPTACVEHGGDERTKRMSRKKEEEEDGDEYERSRCRRRENEEEGECGPTGGRRREENGRK
eukprot:7570728-Pyramimonas_sp.AAC.1